METQLHSNRRPSGRVYRYSEPHLRLEDGTPLYLEWVLEGDDLDLYAVPAEAGGWLRRRAYEGPRSSLEPVSPLKTGAIVGLLWGGTEQAAQAPLTPFGHELTSPGGQTLPLVVGGHLGRAASMPGGTAGTIRPQARVAVIWDSAARSPDAPGRGSLIGAPEEHLVYR